MKFFILIAVLLFGAIGVAGWLKRGAHRVQEAPIQEIALGTSQAPIPIIPTHSEEFPEVDRIEQLFVLDAPDSRLVETVSFTSRVPWLADRPAWIADYASHYQTSRHFIARSLNQKIDYTNQNVHPGDRFNVLKKNVTFHLLVDLSQCRMWFYGIDNGEKILLKTYRVGVGKQGGASTPLGKYELGDKVAIYRPGITGYFQDEKVEMIRVFGTRWLPFDKGFGLHGVPWIDGPNGELVEDRSKIGKYDSDGCIRMASEDIEELFAIVITKKTSIEIVKEFKP